MDGGGVVEVKINKEIKNYKEAVFWGLTLRQTVFSALACVVAVITYFAFSGYLSVSVLSWVCVVSAIPFAAFGFIQYNEMPLETFLYVWFRYTICIPHTMHARVSDAILEDLKDRRI